VLKAARERHRSGRCRLLGAHLEGPFLAHARRGAHPAPHLCPPSRPALLERIGGFEAEIALVTLAPELAGAGEVIRTLRELGIVVSLGHSEANEAEASASFSAGVTMLTHSLNAMAGLHHRAPGPVAAALLGGEVCLGLIADGVHLAPSMAVLLQRLAPDRIVLVSDALAPYGLADGRHRWDERELLVEQGTCRLADGTLAGRDPAPAGGGAAPGPLGRRGGRPPSPRPRSAPGGCWATTGRSKACWWACPSPRPCAGAAQPRP
jgi:N-acetylglucosamine-6-phosphate deacetylase